MSPFGDSAERYAPTGRRSILTKPLGTGALSTAAKAGLIEDTSHIELLTETMARLNRVAAELSMTCNVSASTDITGFGLLGHANEMAGKDQRYPRFESRNLPLLPSAEAMAKDGILPGGCYRNRAYAGSNVAFEDDVPLALSDLMFDPQTSGGLLLAMKPDDAALHGGRRRKRAKTFGRSAKCHTGTVFRSELSDLSVQSPTQVIRSSCRSGCP